MTQSTPLRALQALLAARARGDVQAALTFYQPGAVVVLQSGDTLNGGAAITSFIEATIALPIRFGEHMFVEAEDVALHLCEWTISTTDDRGDALLISGRTADVLRKQHDGVWLVAIDNPWGVSLLDPKSVTGP